ncbi:hypothetical protein BQ8482_40032 [Mesorhizobium delmotii]|uniref:Integrase n=1 Tax=Mesorhizobium delmotii TaxID=1631247 RepID=A0A2P9ASU8_9HYPH|nr:hypothetical protein BQ8482_40032 [Mesorhizobium delmotii]
MYPGRGRTGEQVAGHSLRSCLAWSAEERLLQKQLGHASAEMGKAQAKGYGRQPLLTCSGRWLDCLRAGEDCPPCQDKE